MKFRDNIKGILAGFLLIILIHGILFITGCSNVRIVYPNEAYIERKQSLPDNVRLVEYQRGELRQGYVELDNETGIYTIHCHISSAKCLEHELWHVRNWNKTHRDMPEYLQDIWEVEG